MRNIDNFTERIELIEEARANSRDKAPGDFIKDGDVVFAGRHLLIDFWGASRLNEKNYIEESIREAVEAADATLLYQHLHVFTPFGGLSGVALLSESHISIHTWPEFGFAALDIFMCGAAKPDRALAVLRDRLSPTSVHVDEYRRGVAP